jgi:hypothetical protein
MPVVRDFWTTFQWLRELRQTHDERLVAVYFRVPDGDQDRAFMRRVRAAYARGIQSARNARLDREVVSALADLDVPLERARGRLAPKSILAYARSPNPAIRRTVARLLGYFDRIAVERVLQGLLHDDAPDVGNESVEALLHTGGTKRTATLVADAPVDVIAHFIDALEYQAIDVHTVAALERYSTHTAGPVRESVSRVGHALLIDFEGPEPLRRRLEDLS